MEKESATIWPRPPPRPPAGGGVAGYGATGAVQEVFHFASFAEIVPLAEDASSALALL